MLKQGVNLSSDSKVWLVSLLDYNFFNLQQGPTADDTTFRYCCRTLLQYGLSCRNPTNQESFFESSECSEVDCSQP